MNSSASSGRGHSARLLDDQDTPTEETKLKCASEVCMRPKILNPLFASVSSLPGVGPKLVKVLTRLLGGTEPVGARVIDALFHLPSSVLDRRLRPKLIDAPFEVLVMVAVTPERYIPSTGRGPFRVYC